MKAVIVLEALRNGCNSCSSIADYATKRQISMSEKTIHRHVKLLRDLGYIIYESERGFVLKGEGAKNNTAKFGTSAYPIIILKIIAQFKYRHPDQKTIINLIKVYYGCEVNRKAVGRNIKRLRELGYIIERRRGGYKLVAESDAIRNETELK